MQKYIKYTDKNGKEIEKKYADSELMDILRSRDNSYAKMTIIDELSFGGKNEFSSIDIRFYNNIPADKDAVIIKVCGIEQENVRQFILDLEKLLNKEFPDWHKNPYLKTMKGMKNKYFSMVYSWNIYFFAWLFRNFKKDNV